MEVWIGNDTSGYIFEFEHLWSGSLVEEGIENSCLSAREAQKTSRLCLLGHIIVVRVFQSGNSRGPDIRVDHHLEDQQSF